MTSFGSGDSSSAPGVNLLAPGVLLADRLESPCSDDLFSNSESVFLYARGKFNCAGQRARLRTRGPEAPRPKVR
jgi:hypothetical protein